MTTYTVEEGDHLSLIAVRFGFRDYHTIWDDRANADLKRKRGNPHVLMPGDSLYIPEKEEKTVECDTAKVHRFSVPVTPLKLRIALRDFDNLPIGGADCQLEISGSTLKLQSTSEGLIETDIPNEATAGVLRVPALELEYAVKIGYLDPLDEDTGWRARLINLGYCATSVAGAQEQELSDAIEEFQCDHDLPVTGQPDAATRAKLKQIHGC